MKYLMNVHTGTVDSFANWESDSEHYGWSLQGALEEKHLVEVKKENGDWVEV